MVLLLVVGAAAFLHAAVYVAVLRRRVTFATSSGVLRYHVLFSGSVTVLLLAWLAATSPPDAAAIAVAAVSLLGIYSMSFLELWALADGGYSLAILRYLVANPGANEEDCVACFSRLGVAKQQQRLASIVTLGFARRTGDRLAVSSLGRWVAIGSKALLQICNIRQRG